MVGKLATLGAGPRRTKRLRWPMMVWLERVTLILAAVCGLWLGCSIIQRQQATEHRVDPVENIVSGFIGAVVGAFGGYATGRRRLSAVLVAALVLGLSACSCTPEKRVVSDIRATHRIILPRYLRYVEEDPELTQKQKDDHRKLVESLERLTLSLERSVED